MTRGIQACFQVLKRRQAWLETRAGGSLDRREAIAIRYALALLEEANRLDPALIAQLEELAVKSGLIREGWADGEEISWDWEEKDKK